MTNSIGRFDMLLDIKPIDNISRNFSRLLAHGCNAPLHVMTVLIIMMFLVMEVSSRHAAAIAAIQPVAATTRERGVGSTIAVGNSALTRAKRYRH
jgi:hypothetical protein